MSETNEEMEYMAQKLGFKNVAEYREKRKNDEMEEQKARLEAELKANGDKKIQTQLAEDAEIREALMTRVRIKVDGKAVENPGSPQHIVCTACGRPLPFAREMLLQGIRKATLKNPAHARLEENPPMSSDLFSPRFVIRSPSLIFTGRKQHVEQCGHVMEIEMEIQCTYDGEKFGSLKGC